MDVMNGVNEPWGGQGNQGDWNAWGQDQWSGGNNGGYRSLNCLSAATPVTDDTEFKQPLKTVRASSQIKMLTNNTSVVTNNTLDPIGKGRGVSPEASEVSGAMIVPITDFIRPPSKRQNRRAKDFAKKQHNSLCTDAFFSDGSAEKRGGSACKETCCDFEFSPTPAEAAFADAKIKGDASN